MQVRSGGERLPTFPTGRGPWERRAPESGRGTGVLGGVLLVGGAWLVCWACPRIRPFLICPEQAPDRAVRGPPPRLPAWGGAGTPQERRPGRGVYLVARAAHDGGEHGPGRVIPREARLHQPGAVVAHQGGGLLVVAHPGSAPAGSAGGQRGGARSAPGAGGSGLPLADGGEGSPGPSGPGAAATPQRALPSPSHVCLPRPGAPQAPTAPPARA